MIAIDLGAARFYKHREIMDQLSAAPLRQWVRNITVLDTLSRQAGLARVASKRRSCAVASFRSAPRMEDLELILHPMVEEAKEAVGSMGNDAPLAVLSEKYRGLHHFFRQNFSQVTNPPIDGLRERRVMTPETRLGRSSATSWSRRPASAACSRLPISRFCFTAEFEAVGTITWA